MAVKTHGKMGITAKEIKLKNWKLPHKSFEPETIEAQILCYADRFHVKNQGFLSAQTFITQHEEIGLPEQVTKFKAAAKKFGIPNVALLAQKYNQPSDKMW